jgi:hypothetical protein
VKVFAVASGVLVLAVVAVMFIGVETTVLVATGLGAARLSGSRFLCFPDMRR